MGLVYTISICKKALHIRHKHLICKCIYESGDTAAGAAIVFVLNFRYDFVYIFHKQRFSTTDKVVILFQSTSLPHTHTISRYRILALTGNSFENEWKILGIQK